MFKNPSSHKLPYMNRLKTLQAKNTNGAKTKPLFPRRTKWFAVAGIFLSLLVLKPNIIVRTHEPMTDVIRGRYRIEAVALGRAESKAKERLEETYKIWELRNCDSVVKSRKHPKNKDERNCIAAGEYMRNEVDFGILERDKIITKFCNRFNEALEIASGRWHLEVSVSEQETLNNAITGTSIVAGCMELSRPVLPNFYERDADKSEKQSFILLAARAVLGFVSFFFMLPIAKLIYKAAKEMIKSIALSIKKESKPDRK